MHNHYQQCLRTRRPFASNIRFELPRALSWSKSSNRLVVAVLLIMSTMGCGRNVVSENSSDKQSDQVSKDNSAQDQTDAAAPALAKMSISDMVDRFDDAVVFITVSDALGNDIGVGTGCIIDQAGMVATNRHVIEDAVSARVQLRDGSRLPVAGIMAVDESHDLAIIKVNGMPESIASFPLKPPPRLRPGDGMVAIGHPSEFRFTVSDGILSATRRTDELPVLYQQGLHLNPETNWLQTTAAISNGSSGGPLLTTSGELVGINTWVAGDRNIGFAVSVEHLVELTQSLSPKPQQLPLPYAPVVAGEMVAALSRDYYRELRSLADKLRATEDKDAFIELVEAHSPAPTYVAKCLLEMQRSDSLSDKADALLLAHKIWGDSLPVFKTGRRHLVALYESADESLTQSKEISRAVSSLGNGHYCPQLSMLLRRLFTSHPSPAVRARAGMALVNAMRVDRYAERHIPEQIEMLERLKSLFPEQVIGGVRVQDEAFERLARLRSLRVGAKVQHVAGRDHLGSPIRLSDFSGDVVLLDFWSDGSPRCRNMYTQKRELMEELKDLPFTLLGVNCDETPGRLESLIESGDIAGANIFDGRDGRLGSQWLVQNVPANFVLDSQAIIRFMNVSEQGLKEAVHALLEEDLLRFPQDVSRSGATWNYYYDSAPPPENWMARDFDVSGWRQGQAPLGYGDPRVKTLLDHGDIDGRRLTAFFRREFTVDDPSIGRLICELDVDDGAIVYLNGVELLKSNVPQPASWNSLALLNNNSRHVFDLDPKRLVAGINVVAVEVHQADLHSADLFFDLALGSGGMNAERVLAARSYHTVLQFCQIAAQLDAKDTAVDKVLASLQEHENAEVASWALAARIQRAAKPNEISLPDADEERRKAWATVSGELNQQVWEIVSRPSICDHDAHRAVRKSAAGWRLLAGKKDRNAGMVANTHGVALYRAGRFKEAIAMLRQSMELREENAADLAYSALAYHRLGSNEEARASLDKAKAFQHHSSWAGEDDAAAALGEAAAVIE